MTPFHIVGMMAALVGHATGGFAGAVIAVLQFIQAVIIFVIVLQLHNII